MPSSSVVIPSSTHTLAQHCVLLCFWSPRPQRDVGEDIFLAPPPASSSSLSSRRVRSVYEADGVLCVDDKAEEETTPVSLCTQSQTIHTATSLPQTRIHLIPVYSPFFDSLIAVISSSPHCRLLFRPVLVFYALFALDHLINHPKLDLSLNRN